MRSCGVTHVSTLFQESLFYWRKRHVSCFPLNHSFPNRYLCLLNIFGNYTGMWMWFLPVLTCFIMSSVLFRHIIAAMLPWFHCIWAPFSWMASRGRVLSHSCFTSETEPEKKEKDCTNKSKSKWNLLSDFFVVYVISCTVLHALPLDGKRAAGLVDAGSVLACHGCAAAQSEVVQHYWCRKMQAITHSCALPASGHLSQVKTLYYLEML